MAAAVVVVLEETMRRYIHTCTHTPKFIKTEKIYIVSIYKFTCGNIPGVWLVK